MFQPRRAQRGGEGNSTMVTEDAMHRPSYSSSCVPAHGQAESHSAKREEAAKGNPEDTDVGGPHKEPTAIALQLDPELVICIQLVDFPGHLLK